MGLHGLQVTNMARYGGVKVGLHPLHVTNMWQWSGAKMPLHPLHVTNMANILYYIRSFFRKVFALKMLNQCKQPLHVTNPLHISCLYCPM